MIGSESGSCGIGFLGWITLIFIVLKSTKYIDWSWWWVLAPIWVPAGVLCLVITVIATIFLATWLGLEVLKRKRREWE